MTNVRWASKICSGNKGLTRAHLPEQVGRSRSPRSRQLLLLNQPTRRRILMQGRYLEKKSFEDVLPAQVQENKSLEVPRAHTIRHVVGESRELEGEEVS